VGGGAEQPHIFCLARTHAPSPRDSRRHHSSPCDSSHHYRRAPAPSAPRSWPPAATLCGGLRPGSLRVHDPCKPEGHGSRPGFPGRRLPGDPAAPGNVARALQVLPKQARRALSGGRGELGLDPAEPGLRPAGVPPPERSVGGGGRPAVPRFVQRGSMGSVRPTRGIVPPGKPRSPSPPGLGTMRCPERRADGAVPKKSSTAESSDAVTILLCPLFPPPSRAGRRWSSGPRRP